MHSGDIAMGSGLARSGGRPNGRKYQSLEKTTV